MKTATVHPINKNGNKPQRTGFTNQHLMTFYEQIATLNGSLVFMLLKSKMNEFHKHNGVRYQSLQEKIKELQKKHFQFKEDGGVKTEMVAVLTADGFPDGDKQTEKVVCNEGFLMEDYDKAFKVLMEQDCNIEF